MALQRIDPRGAVPVVKVHLDTLHKGITHLRRDSISLHMIPTHLGTRVHGAKQEFGVGRRHIPYVHAAVMKRHGQRIDRPRRIFPDHARFTKKLGHCTPILRLEPSVMALLVHLYPTNHVFVSPKRRIQHGKKSALVVVLFFCVPFQSLHEKSSPATRRTRWLRA